MPTSRPRHTITETPPVQEALDELRSLLDGASRIDFAELLTIGARAKAQHLRADGGEARGARMRLAQMILAGAVPVDVDAADQVKHLRLSLSHDN